MLITRREKHVTFFSLIFIFPFMQCQLDFFNAYQKICSLILERERKRERNIKVREKYQLVASPKHPYQGLNLQPRYVP